MQEIITLSSLAAHIHDTLLLEFEGETFWITARTVNVKKYEKNRRCYLTLEDYENGAKTAEIKAVFWSNYYNEIEKFENQTRQVFKDGIEITCRIKVRFHKIYGMNLDIIEIDLPHVAGIPEQERQQKLDRLVKENPAGIQLFDGIYRTFNNRLPLPPVIENIALITAPGSDGERDFMQEIKTNRHGYTFAVTPFLTTIQGERAHQLIMEQLRLIEISGENFDAVAIVRGGGAQSDFKAFDDYELARYVALFPVPVFTGIGHDRNQSITDLMAREFKTPTKLAATFVEHNFEFENRLINLKNTISDLVAEQLNHNKTRLEHIKRLIKLSSPLAILNRGFAIVSINDKIITNPADISKNQEIQTRLGKETIYSTVNKKIKDEE